MAVVTRKRKPGRPVDLEARARRRAEILDVAIRVFAKVGFPNADLQVVADELGVGKGTIYRHFETKEKLFLAAADAGMQQLVEHIFGRLEGVEDPVDYIRTAGLAYVDFFQKRPELVEILIQERAEFRDSIPSTHLVYRDRNRKVFEDVLRDGLLRDVNIAEATTAFANLLYGTVVCGCLEGSSRRLNRMGQSAVDLFLHSILQESPGRDTDSKAGRPRS